jgi:SAM-dependent methyltransferase
VDNRRIALEEAKVRLKREHEENERRLGSNPFLAALQYPIADPVWLITKLRGPCDGTCLIDEVVEKANRIFHELFCDRTKKAAHPIESDLIEMTRDALDDPRGFEEKIGQYEREAGRAEVTFVALGRKFDVIVTDPLRKKEVLSILDVLLSRHNLLANEPFHLIDFGTGNGRFPFAADRYLSSVLNGSNRYLITGIDINSSALEDAERIRSERKEKLASIVDFRYGDMTNAPFRNETASVTTTLSTAYVLPTYDKVRQLLEMLRVLIIGGVGIMTGPNQKFRIRPYARYMVKTNWEMYLKKPMNAAYAASFGPTEMLIEGMAIRRRDFALTDTNQFRRLLQMLGCDDIVVKTWPDKGGPDLYSLFCFKKTNRTARVMKRWDLYKTRTRKTTT